MKVKKIISLCVAAVVALCVGVTTAFAAPECDASFTMTSSNAVNAGDTTTLEVHLSENANLGAITFDLLYNTEELEYIQDSAQYNTGVVQMADVNASVPGRIQYAGISLDPIMEGGVVLSVQFKALKPGCSVELDLIEVGLGDFDTTLVTDQVKENSMSSIQIQCAHGTKQWETTQEPTHTEAGTRQLVCTACGQVFETESIPAEGHSFGNWEITKEPTCTESGMEQRSCSVCGEIETREVAPLGHDEGSWTVTVEPTCTTDGAQELHCNRCGALLDTQTVAATGHQVDEWESMEEATCTEGGVEQGICSVCGETVTQEVAPLGHDQGAWTVTIQPTCEEKGERELHCTRCGILLETEELEAAGHQYGQWIVEKEATTEQEGLQYRQCSVCGAREEETIPRLTDSSKPSEGGQDDSSQPSASTGDGTADENGNPSTGESMMMLPLGVLAVAAATLLVLQKKKSKDQ